MPYLSDTEPQGPPKLGLILLQGLVLSLFFILSLRLWYIQVHKGEQYGRLAEENQLRREVIHAPRGTIMDRNGRLLALNQPGYALTLVREDCKDVPATLEQISRWTGIGYVELQRRFDEGKRDVKSFERMTMVPDISIDLLARIEANSVFWPGLEISIRPRRVYPHGMELSNILGYLSEATREDIAKDKNLRVGDTVGRQGVELELENALRGAKGLRQLEVDATGRSLKSTVLRQPTAGRDVRLSIDLELQSYILKQFEGQAGAAVVLEPDTGQILALVTSPTYDNNIFTSEDFASRWEALNKHPRKPLLNRAIQSTYPPGSVWKLLVAACGLELGFVTPRTTYFCPGSYELGNLVFRCWKKEGHGSVALKFSLVDSCDVYYYQLGERLGVDRMSEYALACGFGAATGVNLPNERSGLVPTRKWKRERFNEPWHGGENLNMAIGQGYVLTQPLQVARYIAALVNGGRLLKPNLLRDVSPEVQGNLPLRDSYRELILEAMVETVEKGTARRIHRPDAVIGGKTGTSQVVRIKKVRREVHEMPYNHRDHAWLGTWGEKDGKQYVVVVLVEHGGHGGASAGPLAKAIYRHLFGPDPAEAAEAAAARAEEQPWPEED
jgi:penicillin-binding protein 2